MDLRRPKMQGLRRPPHEEMGRLSLGRGVARRPRIFFHHPSVAKEPCARPRSGVMMMPSEAIHVRG